MPLGRFTAYFFLLMTVCLVAFPRSVGVTALSPVETTALPVGCTQDRDGAPVCAPPARDSLLRRRPAPFHPTPTGPSREAGGPSCLPAGASIMANRASRPLDS